MVIHYPEFFQDNGHLFKDAKWKRQQIIRWCYPSNIGHSRRKFTRSSRDIVWFSKGNPFCDPKADPEPYRNPTDRRVRTLIEAGSVGRSAYDWWVYDIQKNVGKEYSGYSNQIPKPLLRRLILSLSRPGQMVVDPFAGTGSTLQTATSLGRGAWGCDANPYAPGVR